MPESTIVQVIICIFAAFGLAVFAGELCSILFHLRRPCRIHARLILYPKADEDTVKALELAAQLREHSFSNLVIQVEGRTPEEIEALLSANRKEEAWSRRTL